MMRIEFLGTGGATTIPKPTCLCGVCAEARLKGLPYSRKGPSVFIHGPDILIDTPEEIGEQLNRAGIRRIAACFYSHWHPDHVMGRRVWEANRDWRGWPPRHRNTEIFLPAAVARDFKRTLGTWQHLRYLEEGGLVSLNTLEDGDSVSVGGVEVVPLRLAEDYVYGFLLEERGRRTLIVPDEIRGWRPPAAAIGVDLAILPMGILDLDPFTGERRIPEEHPVLQAEATFGEVLEIVSALDARRVLLTHIEEADGVTYDDLETLERLLAEDGLDVRFAYDTLVLEV